MKQVTVAYHDGDFARLVEIERTWARSGGVAATDHDAEIDQRFAALVRANDELRKQLRTIDRELRALRRSGDARLARDLRRDREAGETPCVTGDLDDELATLRRVHDFVRRFRDGEMSLAEFLDGPDADDDEEILEIADALAQLVMASRRRGNGGSSKPRRRRS
jgi:hypothetical protein